MTKMPGSEIQKEISMLGLCYFFKDYRSDSYTNTFASKMSSFKYRKSAHFMGFTFHENEDAYNPTYSK